MEKVIMKEMLKNNQKVANVLDKWNKMYDYQILVDKKNQLYREDLQEECGEIEKYSVKGMIHFYMDEIENKSSHEYDLKTVNGRNIYQGFVDDYKTLAEFKEVEF